MNKERLLRLADKLEGKGPYEKDGPIPRREFDLGEWLKDDCGSAACACGHAADDTWFRRRGLKATDYGAIGYFRKGVTSHGYFAAADFFGIAFDHAKQLFSPFAYGGYTSKVTPKQVATRIRKFVRDQEKRA